MTMTVLDRTPVTGDAGGVTRSAVAWQQYAPDVRGHALPTGHFLPGEAPDLVTAAVRGFLD
jgi:haloacetate dehalogenase